MVQGRIILLLLPAAVYLEKEYSTLDLEVEDVLVLQNNCELNGIKDKLVETNRLFWRAVDNTRNLPHNINLIIPPGICQEQNYNRTRRVQGSAFITSSPGSIVQPGACGEPGYQLNLGFTNTRRNRQLNENLENMVYLTRFLYGVFPEHGVKSSSRFPLFYRNRSEVELNSCTNIPVKGNFTEQCIITQDCLDRIEENQINVTSSLLFSTDTNKFENLERYCTRTTHVKSSPTLQNLVCSEKSVMEVLDFKDEVQLLDPVINILQREEIDAFFFILDTGEEMRKNSGRVWSVLRAGLAPSYKTWPDSTKLTVRYSGTDPMNITDVKKQNLTQDFIKTKVFPESLLGFPNLPLAGVHLLYQNMQLIAEIGFPNIIIVTASSESYLETEYKQVLEFITKNRIPVFVLTFSSAPENPELVNLAKFGSVFSIPLSSVPLSSGEFINGGETWSVLLHNRIINSARSLTPVYKIGKVQPSMYNTSQRFQISPQEINNPGYFLFLCRISEFEISVEAPDRRNFSTSNGDILPVWDGSVPVLFLDSGQWSGNWRIIVQPKLQTSSSGLDILFSSNSAHIRPTLWNQFSRDPQTINGSVTPAVRVYSSSSRNDLSQPEFQVQVLTPSTESIAVTVRDDGLLSPDALDQDGVFSGYFYSLNRTGYYMLWREERIEVVGNLGYRYLTLSPALYVSQPSTQGVDLIPPGRIVDLALVSVSTVQNNVKVSLRFTEPGDDNFDNGVPQLYYIHCGESRENISYQLCSSIRGRVRLSATPRQFKTITLTVKNFDVEVYIGITAQDREGDELWDVPVVVYCVWTLVLFISSLIVLSCLSRETKKFNKRILRGDCKLNIVPDVPVLENLLSRYVRSKLGLGVLQTLANSFDKNRTDIDENIRLDIQRWFASRKSELKGMNYDDKQIRKIILSAVRSGLTKNPLDLRGSRLALEGAKIFLELENMKENVSFLQTSLSVPKPRGETTNGERTVCPTIACDWVASKTLKFLSCLISHPNTTPLLFILFSFAVWLFDTVSDMAIIDKFWNFRLPILYPKNDSEMSEITYLSYQTLTIDLYAPLLLLFLLFSLLFTLLSCSCSRLSDKYRVASEYAKPEREIPGSHDQDPTTILSRYDFNIASATTSSLPQFCIQFSAYIIILYMLETLKGLSVDQATKEQIGGKIEEFSFVSLWFSGIGSALALIVAQYSAFKIQHEHSLTLSQRFLYMISCIFNTISMMCSSLILVVVILIPAATYIGRYHIMAIVILGATVLGIGFLISAALAGFGLDPTKIQTDRIITVYNTNGLLTSFLRFTQTGQGKWRTVLGATTLIGRIFSLVTINLFLPPSQLLVHPFLRFYSTTPRSPALHYAIAKQIIYYNILTLLSSILLCVDIDQYGFNYNITPTTRNLLIYANISGVPCVFIALFILFKFYSSYDLWSSNGVHLVYLQDKMNESSDPEIANQTEYSVLQDSSVGADTENITTLGEGEVEPEDTEVGEPGAESTKLDPEDEDMNESTEADRMTAVRKQSKVLLRKQKERLNRRIQGSCLGGCIVDIAVVDTRGRWMDVSD